MNYAQIKAIEKKNKKRWCKSANTRIPETSGIYVLCRHDCDFKYAYVGQAKHILTRLAQHLSGYQHIDLSLKKHGLFDAQTNVCGWKVFFYEYPENELNEMEQWWIKRMAENGFQLRNKTTGSQSDTKKGLDVEHKQPRGYYDGLKQGYLNARREISKLFKTYLIAQINGTDGVRKQKALEKFYDFINVGGDEDETE